MTDTQKELSTYLAIRESEIKSLDVEMNLIPHYGLPASLKMDYYDGRTIESLFGRTLWQLCFQAEPQLTLDVGMYLAQDRSTVMGVWDAQLVAFTKQFVKIYDKAWTFGLRSKIEYASPTDLDDIWGKIYEQPRSTDESDSAYRSRLQVYIAQLTCCGIKYKCENIISAILGIQNSCTIVTYWPAFVRIYITNAEASKRATERISLLEYIIPKMLASGIDWELFNNFYFLDTELAIRGDVQNSLSANLGIIDEVPINLNCEIIMALEVESELAAEMRLIADNTSSLRARLAIRDTRELPLQIGCSLSGEKMYSLEIAAAVSAKISSGITTRMAISTTDDRQISFGMSLER